MAWKDSSEATVIPWVGDVFGHWAKPATLEVDAGTGSVQVQTRDSADTWVAIPDGTYSADTVTKIDVANMPAIRVVATGDAKYRLTWG